MIKDDLLRLAALPDSVGQARRFIRSQLRDWGLEELMGDCVLVVNELVANAITHGGSESIRCDLRQAEPDVVVVRLRLTLSHLFAEVSDRSVKVPRMRVAKETDEDGRGLRLVEQLACYWDWQLTQDGKRVWACWGLEQRCLRPMGVGERARSVAPFES